MLDYTYSSEPEIESTTEKKMYDDGRRREEEIKKVAEKDSESSYNMMFYNDDDNEISSKKDDQEANDVYYDKKGSKEDKDDKDFLDLKENDIEYSDSKNGSIIKDLHIYADYISDNANATTRTTAKGVIGIPASEIATVKSIKDRMRDKRRPFCSLLKLRQLNFNSPRTLAEVYFVHN